jgi:hypothetical protein
MIQAELYIKNLNTTPIDKPLPRNLSIFLSIKLESRTKISMNKELIKGSVNSFKIYLFMILFKDCIDN